MVPTRLKLCDSHTSFISVQIVNNARQLRRELRGGKPVEKVSQQCGPS